MDSNGKITAIESLSANIVATKFENFYKTNIADVKSRLIDVIGCAIGGCKAPGNAALLELIKDWGGKQESTIWVFGGKVPAHNAAMINTTMARSFDYEVMAGLVEDKVFAGHHAASIVPTALALGEMKEVNGKELLTSVLVADDTAARILVASAVGPVGVGWDETMTMSHFGTTAVAARLLGLDKKQTRNAFGIVLNTIAGAVQSMYDGGLAQSVG